MKQQSYFLIKRLFDMFLAIMGLFITFPLWVFVILGIKISDPGPIFYKAKRIGKDNEEFIMWKFRSMRVPKTLTEESEASFKADVDRIYPFGELCRTLKLDELPQLLNIIDGSMSVVGPRPAAKDQVQVMRSGKYQIASSVKPGLTGPAALYDYIYGDKIQDEYQYEQMVLPTRLELEAYYPQKMGIVYDAKMIWYTVICIFATIFKFEPKSILEELIACVIVEK